MHKLLVYGATGSQGGPVAQKLLEAGYRVRVLTREPARAAGFAGAEVVQGDMADPVSLRTASEGMDGIFLLVPFFTESPTDGVTYGKHVIDAAADAGVKLLVWNTSGEIPPARSGNPGFDTRLDVLEHLTASGVPHVVLQPTAYMENFLGPWTREELATRDTFAYPTPDTVQMQWIATADVATFAAYAFAHPDLANLNLKVCGPEKLNGTAIAERFGRALGRNVRFRAMPPAEFGDKLEQAFPGMGQAAAQGYEMAYQAPERFSSHIDLDALLAKMPVQLTPLETWVKEHQDAFGATVTR